MQMDQLIEKKRDGQALAEREIRFFINGYTAGEIPDYQMAALLMAIYFQGMNRAETVNLTMAMAQSGDMLDLSDICDYAVDKHSSGGVGDKTSLVVLPLVASFGVPIAKMSGRGLGATGGTVDKLESISGFKVDLSDAEFRRIARETGLVIGGQSKSLAPADGLIYALRDVTATVASRSLIASSIMSKKLAAGARGIVLDVKLGRGAFMKSLQDARALATAMVRIGLDAGRDMVALLSDVNQPLGVAVGNALEVAEAVKTLRGEGPADFHQHCVEVASQMLRLAGQGKRWTELAETRAEADRALTAGRALRDLRRMVEAQGGDAAQIDDARKLPQAKLRYNLHARESGCLAAVKADQIAWATLTLGAGRRQKDDVIDHAVGIEVHCNVGDAVAAGDLLMTIHANDETSLQAALTELGAAVDYSSTPVEPLPLFHGVIDGRAS
ncbi:MAG: thymidine phosphorylase [Chloroflexota bacterium]|nr:thymidine phosphorylase [Chloroflexota bacterium]MDE2909277.1 thymidine phosphorylase [Chloroflexota bacterium]